MKRLHVLAVTALLLGSAAVALSGHVQGKDFDHQAQVTEPGSAYRIDWADADPGTVRFALAPSDGAADPTVRLSLFDADRAHLGTYVLDGEWPQLDERAQQGDTLFVVVHQASEAELEVLTQEDREAEVAEAITTSESITVLEGAHEDVAHQLALDNRDDVVHIGALFEGTAEALSVEVQDGTGEVLLQGQAPSLATEEERPLELSLVPAQLDASRLLVRLKADSFNGSLTLDLTGLAEDQTPRDDDLLSLSSGEDEENETEGDDAEAQDNGTEENETEENETESEAQTSAPPLDGIVVTELDGETPVAFQLPSEAESLYVIGREGRAHATVYGPDDAVVGTVAIDEETEGAVTWDEDERLVAVPVQASGPGEHVVVLRSSYEGLLFLGGLEEAPDHRALELQETEVELEEVERQDTLLVVSESTWEGNATLGGGLIAFTYESGATDTHRQVTLYGPEGEEVATDEQGIGVWAHEDVCPEGAVFAPGPSGDYEIEMEGEGLFPSDEATVTLISYVR